MLFRCNLLCLVGGGEVPKWPKNKVMIWDDHQSKCIGELTFRSPVLSCSLRRDRVCVSLINRVYVYRFEDLALLDTFNTTSNARGLLSLSSGEQSVLACPSTTQGSVRVENYTTRKSSIIPCHVAPLTTITLNSSGSLLATTSSKGTLIRLHCTRTGSALRELRRGTEQATVSCVNFSKDDAWLCCSSDHTTVHVFSIGENDDDGGDGDDGEGGKQRNNTSSSSTQSESHINSKPKKPTLQPSPPTNQKSPFRFASPFLPATLSTYLNSSWSFSKLTNVPPSSTCCFLQTSPPTICVISSDGGVIKAEFQDGGEARRVGYHRFIRGNDNKLKLDFEEVDKAGGEG